MARFSPYAIINLTDFYGELKGKYKRFQTYRELKKNIPSLIKESEDKKVHVLRSRRGEWGEWNEVWEMVNGKAKIVKETWS